MSSLDDGQDGQDGQDPYGHIPKVASNLSYTEAFRRFFIPNRPFITIGSAGSWPASSDWVDRSTHTPRWDYLIKRYGLQKVCVHDCASAGASGVEDTTFEAVAAQWQAGGGSSLYIKDWHLPIHSEIHGLDGTTPFYDVPDLFKDDWLHSFCRNDMRDDFAFVYFGARQTFTGLHRDVCELGSWYLWIHWQGLIKLFYPPARHFILLVSQCAWSEAVVLYSS